jgi:hypothetical protein
MIDLFIIETRFISCFQPEHHSPLARVPFECPLLFRNLFSPSSSDISSSSTFSDDSDIFGARGGVVQFPSSGEWGSSSMVLIARANQDGSEIEELKHKILHL